jgi:hypothetical protein
MLNNIYIYIFIYNYLEIQDDEYWIQISLLNNQQLLNILIIQFKTNDIYYTKLLYILSYFINLLPIECSTICNQQYILDKNIPNINNDSIIQHLQLIITIVTVIDNNNIHINNKNELLLNIMELLDIENEMIKNISIELIVIKKINLNNFNILYIYFIYFFFVNFY